MRSGEALARGLEPSLRLHANVNGGHREDGTYKPAVSALATPFVSLGRRGSAGAALVIYTALAVALFSSTWVHPTSWSIGVVGDPQELMWFLGCQALDLTHDLNQP